jgi:uncharacterized protein (DUF2267 family)
MDELIKMVSDKAGISTDQAKTAVSVVMDYLKDKLPEPMAGQVEGVLKGDTSGLADLAGGLGGMFGKK